MPTPQRPASARPIPTGTIGSKTIHPGLVDREFDWRGWTLVGVIVFAFLIAPATIILLPPADYLFALLILPLAPAVLLALTAVWATVRP
nr:hypothetical protein [Halopiger xanaduensis]